MIYKPEMCVWETTFRCNVNCIHCGSDCTEKPKESELSTPEALYLIEQLAELGCKHITLSGGEPLIRKDWAILGHRIKQLGMDLSFISNGVLVTPETVEILRRLKPAAFGISLDAGEPEIHDYIRGQKGCFNKVMQSIDLLLESGIYTSIVTTLQRINFHQLPILRDLLLLKGVDAWQIQSATPQGRMDLEMAITERQFYEASKFIVRTMNHYKNFLISGADCFGYFGALEAYLHPLGWHGCHAGMRCIGIESNGNIRGCLSLPGDEFIEGNIREKSLAEIWNNPDAFAYNRRFARDLLGGYCSECTYGSLCRGGCTERSYGFHKTQCENDYCLYKFERVGFSSPVQASPNPEPEKTMHLYNQKAPLPQGFTLVMPENCPQ